MTGGCWIRVHLRGGAYDLVRMRNLAVVPSASLGSGNNSRAGGILFMLKNNLVKAILECRQATKLFDAFVDDELSFAAQARLRHHVAGCMTCATSVEEKVKLKRLVRRSVGNLTAPATLRDRVRTRIGA